jgi:hypothetical protein
MELDLPTTAPLYLAPSFPGNGPAQLCGVPTTKSTFASIKNKQIFEEELKISEKVFGKLTLGKSEFAESETWHFDGSDKV